MKTKLDKKTEKAFMEAMTKRFHQYENGKLGGCRICRVFGHMGSNCCEACPLAGMSKDTWLPCSSMKKTKMLMDPTRENMDARYYEMIDHLETKKGYVYK